MEQLELGSRVITCGINEPLRDAAKKMNENNVGSVVVVDGGKVVGILTERDLVRAVASGVPLDAPVSRIASRNLIIARQGESMLTVGMKMIEHQIRHIPVVDDDGKVVGVLSIRDVLRQLTAESAYP
ncbi:histidine kinase [Thermocladium modestius]|uniref:Histidine kinase n=1 Tax=Thermocladium modestius TaxID=62609 RepID=A0A830GS59_9CREN|nr:CBS domain-containing protein [Thermocladium modestius]GGP19334.1 histidine kinase [Thermocladium modestius]